MSATQHFLIARATIQKDVQLVSEDVESVDVKVGEPFTIGMSYRIYEASSKKDEWRFHLTTLLDGDEKVADAIVEDRAFVSDNHWAHVRTEHVISAPGEYTLEYTASAALGQGEWSSASPLTTVDTAELKGTLRINAH